MYDEGCVIGRVIGREPAGPNSEFLLVEDRSKASYPQTIAGEFYGVNRNLLEKVKVGDLCRMVGSIRSFKSKTNQRWYTTFNVFTIAQLSEPPALERPNPERMIVKATERAVKEGVIQRATVVRDRVPGEDDDVTGEHPF